MADHLPFRRAMNFEYGVPREVAPGVRRIVAGNPGELTFKGTNTYIVGRGEIAVIDPGPALEEHVDAIIKATRGETITHILITHTHKDHSLAAPLLQQAAGGEICGFDCGSAPRGVLTELEGKVVLRDQFVDHGFRADRFLKEGEVVSGPGWQLEAIATPGHAPDHLCFGLAGQRRVFTGDHVMSWNTTMVAPPEGSMRDYIASLEKLLPRNDIEFFPGHGGRVLEPRRVVKTYLMHRQMREAAIHGCIKQGIGTIEGIVEKVYKAKKESIAAYGAAASSVFAHVIYLAERGHVASVHGALSPDASYVPTPAP